MISPLTSGLMLTCTTGWILPLATTMSVRLWRATFSVCTVMTGSRFLKTATSVSATSTSPMTEKMMIFRRFLGFAMMFGIKTR